MYRFNDARTEVMTGIFNGTLTVNYQHYRQSAGYNALCRAIDASEEVVKFAKQETFATRIVSFYRKMESAFDGFTTRGMTLFSYSPSDPEFTPERKGGLVTCIIAKGDEEVGYGESVCLPEDDFHESAGRDLAFNYAVFDACKRLFRSKSDLCGDGRTETKA